MNDREDRIIETLSQMNLGTQAKIGALCREVEATAEESLRKTRAQRGDSLSFVLEAVKVAESFVQKLKAKEIFACKEGCSYCCHLKVEVFSFEVYGIASYLMERWPLAKIEALLPRLEERAAQAKALSLDDFAAAHLPCVFLENNRCSIYPVRPNTCVAYHSLDKQDCVDAYEGRGDKLISHVMEVLIPVQSVKLGALTALGESWEKRRKEIAKEECLHAALLPILRDKIARQQRKARGPR